MAGPRRALSRGGATECDRCGTYCDWDAESEWEGKWATWESRLAYYDRTYGKLMDEWYEDVINEGNLDMVGARGRALGRQGGGDPLRLLRECPRPALLWRGRRTPPVPPLPFPLSPGHAPRGAGPPGPRGERRDGAHGAAHGAVRTAGLP